MEKVLKKSLQKVHDFKENLFLEQIKSFIIN